MALGEFAERLPERVVRAECWGSVGAELFPDAQQLIARVHGEPESLKPLARSDRVARGLFQALQVAGGRTVSVGGDVVVEQVGAEVDAVVGAGQRDVVPAQQCGPAAGQDRDGLLSAGWVRALWGTPSDGWERVVQDGCEVFERGLGWVGGGCWKVVSFQPADRDALEAEGGPGKVDRR